MLDYYSYPCAERENCTAYKESKETSTLVEFSKEHCAHCMDSFDYPCPYEVFERSNKGEAFGLKIRK